MFQIRCFTYIAALVVLTSPGSRALDSPFLGLYPSTLADNSAVFGNPAGMKRAFGTAVTGALSMEDNSSFSSFRLSQQFNSFGYGYRFSDLNKQSEIALASAFPIFPELQVGARAAYFIQDGPNSWDMDFGLQFSPIMAFRAGYHTTGLWQTEKSPRRGQAAAFGFRPLWFLPELGPRLTAAYEMAVPGFNSSAWDKTEHKAAIYIGLLKYAHVQGTIDLEEPEKFSLGLTVQMSPNQLLGYHHTAVPNEHDHNEYVMQFNTHPKKGFVSLPGKVIELNLNRQIIEGSTRGDWLIQDDRLGHRDLLNQITRIGRTPGIDLVIIKTGKIQCGWAVAAEIREALANLQKKDIQTLAYMETATSLSYYIASAASKIAVQPSGYMHITGFSSEIHFYKKMLDKLGMEAQFIRRGKYKAFQEIFTRENISQEWETNMMEVLNSLWNHYLHTVAKSRGFTADSLGKLLAKPDISPVSARKLGLIDTLLFEDQLKEYGGHKDAGQIRLSENPLVNPSWKEGTEIAVITLDGSITTGKSRKQGLFFLNTVGSETLTSKLKRARRDGNIKGVLLRINSGGGSAIASDVILREVKLLKKAKKPVLVSIGNTCASGAYYIASGADVIIAQKNAILGSIGVFAGKLVLGGLYDKIGIDRAILATSPHADANSNQRKWDSTEIAAVQDYIDEFYLKFTAAVADGRKLDKDSVEVLSQGRIFTGEQAVNNGLADKIGGFETALKMIRERLGLKPGERHQLVDYDQADWTFSSNLSTNQSLFSQLQKEWNNMTSELYNTWIWALSPEALVLGSIERHR